MAVTNPIVTVVSGDRKRLNYTVRDENSAVIDITAATFRWGLSRLDSKVREPTASGAVVFAEKTVGSGITITSGPLGTLTVEILEANTASLVGDFYHELEMVLSGETSTVAFGKLVIKKDLLE